MKRENLEWIAVYAIVLILVIGLALWLGYG